LGASTVIDNGADMVNNMTFIRGFGFSLIGFSILGILTLFISASMREVPAYFNYFGITITSWYLLTGIGMIAQRKWGYFLFKFFLYFLLLAFPVGTFVSYKALKYMKKNGIRSLFF
jgi:hypothetical protein